MSLRPVFLRNEKGREAQNRLNQVTKVLPTARLKRIRVTTLRGHMQFKVMVLTSHNEEILIRMVRQHKISSTISKIEWTTPYTML